MPATTQAPATTSVMSAAVRKAMPSLFVEGFWKFASVGVLYWFARSIERTPAKMPNPASATPAPKSCLLYTSDAADERSSVDLGGRRIIKKKKKIKYTLSSTINKKDLC